MRMEWLGKQYKLMSRTTIRSVKYSRQRFMTPTPHTNGTSALCRLYTVAFSLNSSAPAHVVEINAQREVLPEPEQGGTIPSLRCSDDCMSENERPCRSVFNTAVRCCPRRSGVPMGLSRGNLPVFLIVMLRFLAPRALAGEDAPVFAVHLKTRLHDCCGHYVRRRRKVVTCRRLLSPRIQDTMQQAPKYSAIPPHGCFYTMMTISRVYLYPATAIRRALPSLRATHGAFDLRSTAQTWCFWAGRRRRSLPSHSNGRYEREESHQLVRSTPHAWRERLR